LLDDRSRSLWNALADQLAADGAELFRQLRPEPFDHFEAVLDEDSEEFVELVELPPRKFKKAYRYLLAGKFSPNHPFRKLGFAIHVTNTLEFRLGLCDTSDW
jgi:hypothetical protein